MTDEILKIDEQVRTEGSFRTMATFLKEDHVTIEGLFILDVGNQRDCYMMIFSFAHDPVFLTLYPFQKPI